MTFATKLFDSKKKQFGDNVVSKHTDLVIADAADHSSTLHGKLEPSAVVGMAVVSMGRVEEAVPMMSSSG